MSILLSIVKNALNDGSQSKSRVASTMLVKSGLLNDIGFSWIPMTSSRKLSYSKNTPVDYTKSCKKTVRRIPEPRPRPGNPCCPPHNTKPICGKAIFSDAQPKLMRYPDCGRDGKEPPCPCMHTCPTSYVDLNRR